MELQKLNEQQRKKIEWECIDTLVAWKSQVDRLASDTAAARWAIVRAKEAQVWEGKYGSFKEWLEEECDITERWAYELISSAKVIAEIEEAAGGVKELAELVGVKNVAKLRALPARAIARLKGIKPVKAAKAVLSAIQKSNGVPSAEAVAMEVARYKRRDRTEPLDDHPVLVALDNEWVEIDRSLAYADLKPKDIFKRLRAAVEKVL